MISTKKLIVTAVIGAGTVAGVAAGAGNASAKVAEGTYNFCVQTQYGSSADERCNVYRVVGNQLIGPANTPLTLTDTATGAYTDIEPVSRLTLIKTANGYKAINSVLGIPVATSTFIPVAG
ncbi:hypothetical protein AAFP30_23575 [Gordonia sp. CPCC 205515]|uniref:hypothetical protein n=1 Tax=Gordonia sp. CPCC 205515 TaxID=3140791 RepID=UPI003AF3668F